MFARWFSVKWAVNCGNKASDVIQRRGKPMMMHKKCAAVENGTRNELSIRPTDSEIHQEATTYRQNCTGNWFYVMEIGDPSRNIIERIFRAASTQPSGHSRKIKEVIRVQNSVETLERFEQCRETVKSRSKEQYKKHPRSTVDGNEQLLFHSTTMNCCTGKESGVSNLCRDSTCRLCRIIQSGFSTANKKIGIQLSTSSEELYTIRNCRNGNQVVMVCRVIAGRVVNMVDMDDEDDYDSISITGGRLNYMIARNSRAVLPCFVIVLN